MTFLRDYQGHKVRLTLERLNHIREHPEMDGLEDAIAETLSNPTLGIQSLSDQSAALNYRFYFGTRVGDKWLCVVVKYSELDTFVLTALSYRQIQERNSAMAQNVKVWFDKEGDFLEVRFSDKAGYLRETDQDSVMERVDEKGNVLGFTVMAVSKLDKDHPLVAQLATAS